jgi:hypothetical protein
VSDENVRAMWSDDELDAALAAFRSDVDTDVRLLRAARSDLLAAATAADENEPDVPPAAPAPSRWAVVAAAAAAVIVVVAGVLVAVATRPADRGDGTGTEPTTSSRPKNPVDRIRATDEPLSPGQFRYVHEHQWWSEWSETEYVRKLEYRYEIWVPAQERQVWMERRETTGRSVLLNGSEKQAHAEGVDPPERTVETYRAACGEYFAPKDRPCEFIASFAHPNQAYMASMTRDPDELLAQLREMTEGGRKGTPDSMAFQLVSGFLHERWVPADLRMVFYRVLAKLPMIEIAENVPNLAGRKGTSFAVRDKDFRREIIVDPGTGQVIGERWRMVRTQNGMKAGTVVADSSLETVVVDGMGARPGG